MQTIARESGSTTAQFADWKAPATKMSLVSGEEYVNPKADLSVQRRSSGGLSGELATARDVFLRRSSKETKSAVAYDLEMDMVLYGVLAQQRGELGYAESRDALNTYVKMQLETHLGERLHVGISRFVYDIVDGQLLTEDTGEPMLEMIRRGKDYRLSHGKETDRLRESAEVEGFAKIQQVMTDEKTPPGTMMLFASPPGDKTMQSNYPMNLYEVHQKMADGKVVAYRFTSGLSAEATKDKLAVFDPWYKQENIPSDADFIGHPVKIIPGLFKTPEDVHEYMHQEHAYLNARDFAFLKKSWQPIMDKIVSDFEKDPNNKALHEKNHRALLNYADETHERYNETKMTITTDAHRDISGPAVRPWIPPQIDMDALSRKQVRFVMGGCGTSGDSTKAASVAEYDPNRKETGSCGVCGKPAGDNHYHCPTPKGCGKTYADETAKAQEERTKKCTCGFEFGC